MSCLIRPAEQADIREIDRIQRACPEAVLWPAADYLAYDCLIALVDGRIAAFLATRSLGPGESEVLNLAVDPAFRRRGFARSLLRRALAASPGDWFLEVRESNAAARSFYVSLGFRDVATRPRYYRDSGEAAVVMHLQPCYCHR